MCIEAHVHDPREQLPGPQPVQSNMVRRARTASGSSLRSVRGPWGRSTASASSPKSQRGSVPLRALNEPSSPERASGPSPVPEEQYPQAANPFTSQAPQYAGVYPRGVWPQENDVVESTTSGDRYQLLQVVGTGSYGTVWVCRPEQGGADEALKVVEAKEAGIHLEARLPRGAGELFSVLATHDVPFITRYFEHWPLGSKIFVRMELLTGTLLSEYMDTLDEVSERLVGVITEQLFQAIAYLHSRNVMHRDVKPNNVFLSPDDMTVKLFDFGCAALIAPGVSDPPVTVQRRAILGGFGYLAPEVLTGEYSQLVDVWSGGVVVYELFAADVPIAFTSIQEYQNLVELGMLKRGVDLTCDPFPQVSASARECLSLALTVDPAERPTAAQVLRCAWLAEGSGVGVADNAHAV